MWIRIVIYMAISMMFGPLKGVTAAELNAHISIAREVLDDNHIFIWDDSLHIYYNKCCIPFIICPKPRFNMVLLCRHVHGSFLDFRFWIGSREIGNLYNRIALKFDRHIGSSACQISKRSDNSKYKSCGFETSRDLGITRLIWYWNGPIIWITADLSSIQPSRPHCSRTLIEIQIFTLKRIYLNISWKQRPSYPGPNVYIIGYILLSWDFTSEQMSYSENIPVNIYIYIHTVCTSFKCVLMWWDIRVYPYYLWLVPPHSDNHTIIHCW